MEYKEIVITVSDDEIRVNPAVEVPIRLIRNEIKLQSSVARALQRVLRTYKFGNSNDKIFDNEDYQLLGQLLCQIIIGKSVQAIIRMALVDIIDTENKTLKKRCRIYLEFDPKIDE